MSRRSSNQYKGLRLRRENFTNIGSGSYHSFAIQEDGTVWGWGSNLYGEAGQEVGRIDKIGDGSSIPAVPRIKYIPLTSWTTRSPT